MFAIGSMLTIPLLFIPSGETMVKKLRKNLHEKGIWFPDRECERSKQRNASPPQCTLGMSLYNFPGNERRQVLFMTQALESD